MLMKRCRWGLFAATLMLPGCNDSPPPKSIPSPPATPVETQTTESSETDGDTPKSGDDAAHDSLYTVADYDPDRDASQDLAATIERAKAEGKRIILEIGGQW